MRTAHDWARACSRPRTTAFVASLISLTFVAACGDSHAATAPRDPSSPQLREATAFTENGITYPQVKVAGGSSALAIGAHETLTAQLSTPSSSWLGEFVNWTSSNSGVASVSNQNWGGAGGDHGYVTGVASGTATITGTTQSGTTGSFTITVGSGPASPPPTDGSYANEPAGMSGITERPFDAQTEDGWGQAWGGSNFTIIRDATAPKSPDNVIQIRYPAGFVGGNAPGQQDHPIAGNPTEFYGCFWVKYSSNFQGNPSGVNKILYLWSDDGLYGVPAVYLSAQASGSGDFQPQVRTQDAIAQDLRPNVSGQTGYTFPRNTWVKWEFYLQMNTPGQRNGVARVWMNGTKVSEYDNVWLSPASTQRHWNAMQLAPYWGGIGGIVSATQYLYVDHLYGTAR